MVRLVRHSSIPRWTAASYAGAGAVFLIEAIATDLMNCRHYWWLIAVVASWEVCTRGHMQGNMARPMADGVDEKVGAIE